MVAMDGLHTLHDERAKYEDPYDERYNNSWDGASLKPYRTKDEYLYAMREDLAEWLSNLYDLDILPESFFDRLENGVVLCQHANNVRKVAIDFGARNFPENGDSDIVHGIFIAHDELRFKLDAKPGTFLARDNVSNFIHWCRHSLRIKDVLLFESDDLVMRKNDRSFILCLLEVARRGGLVGMPVPMLVQLEQEIDRELNAGTPSEPDSYTSTEPASPSSATTTDVEPESEAESEGKPMDYSSSPEPSPQRKGSFIPRTKQKSRRISSSHSPEPEGDGQPPKQITLKPDVLKTLDELVRDLVKQCTCPVQFPMIREAEGKYRIGDSNTLIFVRILRKHVMVRVGGGWDTLTHYLDKHDPCRCTVHKKNRRSTAGADFGPSTRNPAHKRKTSVDQSHMYHTTNGRASDGGSSQSENSEYKSGSPAVSPRRNDTTCVRPRNSPASPSKRQSSGDTYRPSSLNLSVRNSPRPMRRGSSMGSSSHVVTSPDSSDTYSNPDLGGGITPTKEITPKRTVGRPNGSSRRGASEKTDSDSTACSESVSVKSAGSPIKRRNSSRNLASNNNRTSQTATEEFLRRKRQQARAQSAQSADLKLNREQVVHSAPTSPTRRRGTPMYSSLRAPSKSREMVRRATVCAAEQKWHDNAPARNSRTKSHADTKLPVPRDHSASPKLGRRSSTPSGKPNRKIRPQSARLSGEDLRRNSRTDDPVLLISRNSDGRHRVDSTSSCESNDSSVRSGHRSLGGTPVRRVLESESGAKIRNRSVSLERSNGITDRYGTGDRRRSLFERTNGDRRKSSLDRSSSNRRKTSVERPSSYVPSESVQVRSRSLSRDCQTNRLRVPKSNNTRKTSLGACASPRASPVRSRRRSDIQLPSSDTWDRLDDREGSVSSGASSPIGGPASGVPPATRSRLRPPTAIPKHLRPDPSIMTSLRKDPARGRRPSRIPLPTSHKRLMEAHTRSRSNSLPSILADLLQAWQSVQNSTHELRNMDPFDMSPCLSSEGESISPTLSVRTAPDVQHDSGYEDNSSQKYSPNLGNLLPILPSLDSTNEQS